MKAISREAKKSKKIKKKILSNNRKSLWMLELAILKRANKILGARRINNVVKGGS